MKYCIIILLFGFSLFSFSQEQNIIKKLKSAIKKANKAERLALMDSLSNYISYETKFDNDSIIRATIEYAKELDSLKHYYTLNISEDERSSLIKKNILTHLVRNNSDSLLFIAKQNLILAKSLNNIEAIANAEIGLGTAYNVKSNSGGALRLYFEALKKFEKVNNKDKIALSFMAIANAYRKMEDFKNSIEFYSKGLRLKESINKKDRIYYSILINQSNVALSFKNYQLCFKNSKITKEFFKNDKYLSSMIETNTGFYYNELFKEPDVEKRIKKLGVKEKKQLLDSSLHYYSSGLKKANKANDVRRKSYAYFGLGENAFLNNNYKKAIDFYNKSIPISKSINNLDLLKRSYNGIYLSFLALEDHPNALINYQKLIATKSEIESEENKKILIEQKLVYEHEKELEQIREKNKKRRELLIYSSLGILIFLIIIFFYQRKRRAITRLLVKDEFASKIINTQEEERSRIAKELHDSIGQSLLILKRAVSQKNENNISELKIINNVINEVRTISHDLHPFQFKKLGLVKSLEDMMDAFQKNSDVFYSYEIDDITGVLSSEKELFIFRMLQECFVNVEKHASATACKLTVKNSKKGIKFQIKDNGKGFDLSQKQNGIGLKNLKERAFYINAYFNIKSAKNKGTIITIKIRK